MPRGAESHDHQQGGREEGLAAVGIAYALASRVTNQVGEVVGPDSLFGGIGANGAHRTPGAVQQKLLPAGERYTFSRSDHSAVVGPEVAHAILSAISSTR